MKHTILISLFPLLALACRSSQEVPETQTSSLNTTHTAEESQTNATRWADEETEGAEWSNTLGVIEGTGQESGTMAELQSQADAQYERLKADLAGQTPSADATEEGMHDAAGAVEAAAAEGEGWIEKEAAALVEEQARVDEQLQATQNAADQLQNETEALEALTGSAAETLEAGEDAMEEVLETEEFMRAGVESADWQAPQDPVVIEGQEAKLEDVTNALPQKTTQPEAALGALTSEAKAVEQEVQATLKEFEAAVDAESAATQAVSTTPAGTSNSAPRAQAAPAASVDLTDVKAMEARMLDIATPGQEHQWLDQLKGEWKANVTYWFMPDADPMPSSGTMTNSWALNDRFLQMDYKGSVMGQPFEGFGHIGFDKVRKQYVGYWVDSMGTQMMNVSTGSLSNDRKSLTLRRTALEPITGKEREVKEILTIKSANEHHWQMWGYAPDGTFFRMVEVVYKRK